MSFANRQPRNTRPVMKTSKYTPGQRLNSAAEVMQALLDGHLIEDNLGNVLQLHSGILVDQSDSRCELNLVIRSFRIYTPPKRRMRRVTSERWFAIMSGNTKISDGCFWITYSTEEEARRECPQAFAYHCATVEIDMPVGTSLEVEE